MKTRRINVDLAKVYTEPEGGDLLTTLAWGDEVEVGEGGGSALEVTLTRFKEQPDGSLKPGKVTGYIRPSKAAGIKRGEIAVEPAKVKVLNVDFVDVQQGDAAVIESPDGKTVLLDGGDNQLFARYLAGRYRGTTLAKPKDIDAIVISHGDADHFVGLAEIVKSESNESSFKKIFIRPHRVYHNGLVKRPEKRAGGRARTETELLGTTAEKDGHTYVTDLVTDLLALPEAETSTTFAPWKAALDAWNRRSPIEFRRLAFGDDNAFDFMREEGIDVKVLGPLTEKLNGADVLPFLGAPKKGPRVGHESVALDTAEFTGASTSHTINGHSVVLHLRYGNFTFLFAGDLNDQAERELTRRHNLGELNLRSEVFKVPHHGSAEFSGAFLQAVWPVVSVISSGDESARKEFIHPRATLVGTLGRYSRLEEPLIFVTELVAFFQVEGWVVPADPRSSNAPKRTKEVSKDRGRFFAFSRTAFGTVMVRTDGERLLIYTQSGRADLREAYAYQVDSSAQVVPVAVRSV